MMKIDLWRRLTWISLYFIGFVTAINRKNTSNVTCRMLEVSSTFGTKVTASIRQSVLWSLKSPLEPKIIFAYNYHINIRVANFTFIDIKVFWTKQN